MTSTTEITTASSERAVCAVLDQMYDAWAAADANGIADLYTTDAMVVARGSLLQGNDAVRDWFVDGFAGRLKGSTTIDEARMVRFPAPDAAVVVSTGGVLMPGETSVPAQRLVRATWVLARRDGAWVIAAYHNSPLHAG
jgi:uncharacterized protein (TIGR02246 family)